MKIHSLYQKLWSIAKDDNNYALLQWVRGLRSKHQKDIDIAYVELEVLSWTHHDFEHDQQEPQVIQLCTEILRNKEKHSSLIIAKAYTYRGEIRYYAMDRRKDFDKASAILKTLDQKDKEIKFLKDFIKEAYPLNVRQYLFFNTTALNMYKID